jgi:hypothetical protein
MAKELKDWTFERLVDYFAGEALSALLTEGGKGLKSKVWMAMETAIRWNKEPKRKFHK